VKRNTEVGVVAADIVAGNGNPGWSGAVAESAFDLSEMVAVNRETLFGLIGADVGALGLPRELEHAVKSECALEGYAAGQADIGKVVDALLKGNATARKIASHLRELPDEGQVVPAVPSSAALPTNAKSAGVGTDGRKRIPLAAITTSRWNRSFADGLDEEHVATLQADYEQTGGMHVPVLLVRAGKDGDGVLNLDGAHRLEAKRRLMGPDGLLEPDEYRILPGLNDGDPRCLEISIKANALHSGLSVHKKAMYIARLIEKEGQTRERIAELMKLNLATVSRLKLLPLAFRKLPRSWKYDLDTVPERDSNHTVVITGAHWAAVAATVDKVGVTPRIRKLLEQAHEKRWTVRELDQKLASLKTRKAGKVKPGETAPAGETTPSVGESEATSTPRSTDGSGAKSKESLAIDAGKLAIKLVRDAADALLPAKQYAGIPAKLNAILSEIEKRVAALQEDAA